MKDCNRQYSCNIFYFQFYRNCDFLPVLPNFQCFWFFQLLMLLTFNVKFIKSNTAGRCLVSFQISRWLPGSDMQENRLWDVAGWWLAPSPSGSPLGLCWWVGVSPIRQPKGSQIPLTPLFRFQMGRNWVHMEVIQMRLTCWGFPLWRVGSSASHGSGGCLMTLTGSCNICCTPGQACSAPSEGGWWLSPHSGPPSHTRGSRSYHWSCVGHLDHIFPLVP